MKNVILLHGKDGSPEVFWFPWLGENLLEKGYKVWLPQLPEAKTPKVETWLPYVLENGDFNEETIIVGHSAACAFILALLEVIDVKVNKAILVAGYMTSLPYGGNSILKSEYDFKKIKSHADRIYVLNSDNDPWGADDKKGREIAEAVDGEFILMEGQGHMGSNYYKQPYKEFPLLLKLIAG